MKRITYAIAIAAALLSAPAMANEIGQYNTHGRYQYFNGNQHMSDKIRLEHSDVKYIQTSLHEAGYNTGPIDGVFGPKTRSALRAFQEDHNLKGNGDITEKTLKVLDMPVVTERFNRVRHLN